MTEVPSITVLLFVVVNLKICFRLIEYNMYHCLYGASFIRMRKRFLKYYKSYIHQIILKHVYKL